ncbi:MAG: hypothetical protein QXU54_02175 [Candidatus Micrarchaeia archaeon]
MLASGGNQWAVPAPLHIEHGEFSYAHILGRTREINDYAKKSRDRLAFEFDESEYAIAKQSLHNFRRHLLHFGRPVRDSPAKLKQMIGNAIGPLTEGMYRKIAEYRSYIYSAKRAYVCFEETLLRMATDLEQNAGAGANVSAKIAVLAALEKCRQAQRILNNSYWELDRLSVEIDSRTESLYMRLRSTANALILAYSAWMVPVQQGTHSRDASGRHTVARDSIWQQKIQAPLLHALCRRPRRDDLEKALFETLAAHESYQALRVIAGEDAFPGSLRMRAKSSLYEMRRSLALTAYEKIAAIKRKGGAYRFAGGGMPNKSSL